MSMIKQVESGFTIVEIIVAITVAGFVTLGLSVMVTNLNVVSDRTRDLVTATSAAENKYEDLRNSTYLALSDGTIDFTSELPTTLAEPRQATYTIADSTLTDISAAVKEVDVTIVYNSHGKTETLRFKEFIGELGVGQY